MQIKISKDLFERSKSLEDICASTRVDPFVIIPRKNFHKCSISISVWNDLGELGIKNLGVWVMNNIS
jgi:hypothetical protein